MSRMLSPEMEVIRFNEADVIVASGEVITPVRQITVTDFYNGSPGNIKFEYEGDVRYFTDLNSIVFRTGAGNAEQTYAWLIGKEAEDSNTVSSIIADNPLAAFNGTYHSKDKGKTWLNDNYFNVNQ